MKATLRDFGFLISRRLSTEDAEETWLDLLFKIFKGIVRINVEGIFEIIQPAAVTRSHTLGHQQRILRQQAHHRNKANAFSQRFRGMEFPTNRNR